ncbi:MAG: hypothetical protein U0359_04820 [Byssovorax sp.]
MQRIPRRSPDQTFTNRVGYRIDRFLAMHPALQLLSVLVAATVLAFFFGWIIFAIDASSPAGDGNRIDGPIDGLWWAITRMLDGGTVAGDAHSGFLRQFFGLGVTMIGLVAVTVLTGAFASSFAERLSGIRRGSLPVFERRHLLFLGWNPHAGVIVRELGRTGARMTLVVVSDHDREAIEESVREQLAGRKHRLRVIVRRGDPATVVAVRKAAARRARAVVILPDTEIGHCHDRAALRSLLALQRVIGDHKPRPQVIVEVASGSGREMVHLCEEAGVGTGFVVVEAYGVNAGILAQSVRRPGAFAVARQILSLDALSIYAYPAKGFTGLPFDEAHASLDGGVLVGLSRAGKVLLSPPGDERIEPTDQLLVFSDRARPPSLVPRDDLRGRSSQPTLRPKPLPPLHLLVLRVRPGLGAILSFLDARGPVEATVVAPEDELDHAREALAQATLHRTTVELKEGDPLDATVIEQALATPRDTVLVLAPDVRPDFVAEADADQLISLLHIRRVRAARKSNEHVVVEVRSPETKLPSRGEHRDDFILSRELVGMLLAREIHAIGMRGSRVYLDVFDAVNPSVELRAMSIYAGSRDEVSFADLSASARRRGEVAIGVMEDRAQPRLLPAGSERFPVAGSSLVVIGCIPVVEEEEADEVS